jgi:putative ABC transport system ATP-binding protein
VQDDIVICEGVSKVYRTGTVEVQALTDVDLRIRRGEFTTLIGPSGSGKSTLLNLIGGLDRPTAGHIRVDGRPLDELSPAELANLRLDRIGFVFQAYNLVPVLTARENVELIMELQGEDASARAAASAAVLSEVGLSDLADRRPAALSGGQQQRVAVARAIASRPAIVLADEPTANLDSHTAADLLRTMKSLNETRGITFLISTHDSRVMEFARRLVTLRDGRIAEDQERA